MTKPSDIQHKKSQLRKKLKAAQANIPGTQRLLYTKNITAKILELEEINNARIIFIYISYGTEVGTHALIDILLNSGKTLAVPKITSPESMRSEYFDSWQNLSPDNMGILSPVASKPCNEPFDIAITPGLGFTKSGQRIGFGHGYYDKWFAKNQVGHKIALAFETQLVKSIPVEHTDIKVDKIITEQRVINVVT